MLNVTVQSSAEGAKSYFARSDYYNEGQELVGEWGGKGASLLGLSGKVDKVAFNSLCDNIHPQTGRPLTKITRDGRRVGYDFTWSAPKSISVVHALTGDDTIVDAFRRSIRDTLSEMESEMQSRVRKDGRDFDRTTGNICYAEFIHLTSRPVNGIPCPQLHSHNFVFNATHDAAENQWKAGQFGRLNSDAYYWQAVQQARFANNLQELGYSTRKTKDAFEIDGVPDSVLKKFSLRTSIIERVAEKLGITDPRIKAKLGATTREAKDSSIPYPELIELWESQLTKDEATAIAVIAQDKQPQEIRSRNDQHVQFAIDHMFERQSVVDERRLLALALRHGMGEVTPEGIRKEVDRRDLLKRAEADKTWVTTKGVLAEETSMIGWAVSGKQTCKPLARPGEIQLADQRLNSGQAQAVEHIVTSSDRVILLRGAAGTGKTTLTTEAVHQLNARGKEVVMLAPSAEASRGVLRREGFSEADTLARFLFDETMQKQAKNGVIWVDEASLVGTRTMNELFHIAGRLEARVVLSGDKRQMASVERGAALRVLETIAGLPVAEVTEIQRQQNRDYRDAVTLLSKGRIAEGFDKLDDMGRVKLMPVWDSYEPIAKEFAERMEQATENDRDQAVLIVSPTHAEGRKINDAVRKELRAKGLLGNDEREFDRLVPLQWTEAEKADSTRYTGKEILQFYHNTGPFKAGDRIWASEALDKLDEIKSKHFAVFEPDSICLGTGDAIRMTAGGKTLDGKHRFNNGSVYRVAGFTLAGDIALGNGWVIAKDAGHLSHNYVNTAYAAQGRTVKHVIVAQSALSYPAASMEGFYVAASRGKSSITIWTDDKRELKEAIERSAPRLSATELVGKQKPRFLRRAKELGVRWQKAAMLATKRAAHEIRELVGDREVEYER
ncbi:MAG TPA: MobF family relaxase [Pirellulales bacterium]|jgi:conjugative relaxase-like TrwC/TraI family protein